MLLLYYNIFLSKGIQHDINYAKYLIYRYEQAGALSPKVSRYLSTTCFFHVGGFVSPLNVMTSNMSFIFNHGADLDKFNDTTELLFKEINDYKPFMMICGSHHLGQLSQTSGPKGDLLSTRLSSQQKIFIQKFC